MRILGIDPGVATIGFGVVDTDRNRQALVKCGVITTPAHTQLSSRLEQIFRDMADLLDIFKPDAVSIEELINAVIENDYLYKSVPGFFHWAYEILRGKKRE